MSPTYSSATNNTNTPSSDYNPKKRSRRKLMTLPKYYTDITVREDRGGRSVFKKVGEKEHKAMTIDEDDFIALTSKPDIDYTKLRKMFEDGDIRIRDDDEERRVVYIEEHDDDLGSSKCEDLWRLSALETFKSVRCRFVSLPPAIGNMQNLKHLTIDFASELQYLPEEIGSLSNLITLELDSSRIRTLPDSIGRLKNLEKLDLFWNRELTYLPDSIGRLKNLEEINLEQAWKLTSLPPSFGELANLKYLNLSSIRRLSNLPEEIGNLVNLVTLILSGTGLSSLPPWISRLRNLEELSLYYTKIESLPPSIGKLENLKDLNLSKMLNLKSLPEQFGNLTNLESLNLGMSRLNSLPSSIGRLKKLRTLKLYLFTMKNLHPSIGELKNLRELDLSSCWRYLRQLPVEIGGLINLRILKLERSCIETESLPSSIGDLIHLEELNLRASNVATLPSTIGNLANLKSLDLKGCKGISSLPDSINGLSSLTNLTIEGTGIPELQREEVEEDSDGEFRPNDRCEDFLLSLVRRLPSLNRLDAAFDHERLCFALARRSASSSFLSGAIEESDQVFLKLWPRMLFHADYAFDPRFWSFEGWNVREKDSFRCRWQESARYQLLLDGRESFVSVLMNRNSSADNPIV